MTQEAWDIRRSYVIRRFPIPLSCRKAESMELVDDLDRILTVSHPYVSIRTIGCQVTETELIIVIERVEKIGRIR